MPSCEEEYYSSILLFITKCLEEWKRKAGIDTHIDSCAHLSSINAYPDKESFDRKEGKEEMMDR